VFDAVSGTPDTYYFGKVSSSGNGLGALIMMMVVQ
jgi:hypothetical protein